MAPSRKWENLRSGDPTDISWDFVNAIAFDPAGEVWYGTIGNGWGESRDGGQTWRSWTFDELGPRWLYVAPEWIAVAGDTVFVATADGLRITSDGGETWRDVMEAQGLGSRYLLDLEVDVDWDGPRPYASSAWPDTRRARTADGPGVVGRGP